MIEKPPTIAQLKRKIEQLEARLEEAEQRMYQSQEVNRNNLYSHVDAQIRIKQAIAILSGEEE